MLQTNHKQLYNVTRKPQERTKDQLLKVCIMQDILYLRKLFTKKNQDLVHNPKIS